MIEIPTGTRVYGIQLPIQSQSQTFVADWELSPTSVDLARGRVPADDHGFFYVAVCDHIAVHRVPRRRHGHVLAGLHLDVVLARRHHHSRPPAVACVRAPVPSPARRRPRSSRLSTTSRAGARSSGSAPGTSRPSSQRLGSTSPPRQARRREAPAARRGARARVGRRPRREFDAAGAVAAPTGVGRRIEPGRHPARGAALRRRLAAAGPVGRGMVPSSTRRVPCTAGPTAR